LPRTLSLGLFVSIAELVIQSLAHVFVFFRRCGRDLFAHRIAAPPDPATPVSKQEGQRGQRFDGETKLWEIPGDPEIIKGMIEVAGFQLEGAGKFPTGPVPPMESPDFLGERGSRMAPSFEEPDSFDDDEPPEPPPWWDDELALPPSEDDYFDEPFEAEPPPLAARPVASGPVPASAGRRSGDRIRIRMGDMPLVVGGGEFQAMLALVKSIPGRRFNGDERVWEIPDSVGLDSLGQRVAAAGFVLEQE
jgi:hypothetical protein